MAENPDHTPAYKIFHYYFGCSIPATFAYEKRTEIMGTLQYKNADMEESASKEMVSRQHTVSELIQFHRRGATIILNKPDDAVKIYGWLRDHLKGLRAKVQFGLNHGTIPLEDLSDMDEFATMIYRIARNYEVVDERRGHMDRKMEDMFSRRMIRRQRVVENEHSNEQTPDEKPMREHDSIVSDISHSAIERGLKFK